MNHLALDSTIVTLPQSSVGLGNPYVVFFQPTQKDLPINRPIEALVRSVSTPNRNVSTLQPWRGNVLVAKYADAPFGEMVSCSLNDLPIISTHFLCREPSGNELEVRRHFRKYSTPLPNRQRHSSFCDASHMGAPRYASARKCSIYRSDSGLASCRSDPVAAQAHILPESG